MKKHKQYVPLISEGCFLDYTYCSSPHCKNECGRKMTDAVKKAFDKIEYARVAFANFFGE